MKLQKANEFTIKNARYPQMRCSKCEESLQWDQADSFWVTVWITECCGKFYTAEPQQITITEFDVIN